MGNTHKKSELCDCVMNEVACHEEKRLIRMLFLIGPLLIVCSWLVLVAVHLSVSRILENDALEVMADVQEEGHAFSQQAYIFLQLFWSQMQEDVSALFALSIAAIAVIITKSKLLSYPFRFKEIKKYKTETS